MFLQNLFAMLNEDNNKRILIFACTSILAIHSLIFIHSNSINFALSDDWTAVFAATYYLQNDPAWIDSIVAFGNEHVLLFYRIVMFVGLLLNSFNIQQFAYLNWGFLSIGVWIFYQILRKTDKQLTWLIIPIAALIFSPKMVWTELSASIGLTWVGTFFFIVSVVGVISKEKLTKAWFCLAIFLSIVASLTSVLGLLSWIVGICLLLKGKENRKYLIFWLLATIVIFSIVILTGITQGGRKPLDELIQTATIFWGLEYVSNPYAVGIGKYFVMDINGTNIHQEKFSVVRILIGTVSLSILVFTMIYLLKRKMWTAIPWITFGVIGILSTILTTVGRFGLRLPSENYFIIMSIFTQISLFVLVTMLFLEIKKSNKQKIKNTIKIICLFLILAMFALLGSSYFTGLRNGPIWHDERSSSLQCFDLPSNIAKCDEFHVFGDVKKYKNKLERNFSIFNFLIERKLSIFNEEFFANQEKMRERLNEKWNQLDNGIGIGQIQTINEQSVGNGDQINLNRPIIHVTGWASSNNGEINEVVFFVDEKLFFSITPKNELGNLEKNENEQSRVEWDVQFFSGFIENGCHDFSIGGITDNSKFMLEQQLIICKTKLIYDPNPNW